MANLNPLPSSSGLPTATLPALTSSTTRTLPSLSNSSLTTLSALPPSLSPYGISTNLPLATSTPVRAPVTRTVINELIQTPPTLDQSILRPKSPTTLLPNKSLSDQTTVLYSPGKSLSEQTTVLYSPGKSLSEQTTVLYSPGKSLSEQTTVLWTPDTPSFKPEQYGIYRYLVSVFSDYNLSEADTTYAARILTDYFFGSGSQYIQRFMVFAENTGLCKLCLTFHDNLHRAIVSRNTSQLQNLASAAEVYLPEIYNNPFLDTQDRQQIDQILTAEYADVVNVINRLKTSGCAELPTKICLADQIQSNTGVRNVTVDTNCYDSVCISEQSNIETIFATANRPGETIYTVDTTPTGDYQRYCFKLLDLLPLLTQSNPINPQTGQPFSSDTLNILKSRLRKEIAMYRRYITRS
jgi:hypothetical protein